MTWFIVTICVSGWLGPAGGCGKSMVSPPGDDGGTDNPPLPPLVPTFPRECSPIYAENLLPTFEITIAPAEWAAILEEYQDWEDRTRDGLSVKAYHPLESFRYGDVTVPNTMIRLKGNPCCSWNQEKMQFVISFNEIDPKGRFMGLRKLDLDSPSYDATYLRNRVALNYFHELGVPASCANNARLVINGEYYGLYGNLERVDREFLQRSFKESEGNLYKHGSEQKTDRENPDTAIIDRFWDTTDPDELATFVDIEQMITAWAAEAMIPQADGYWSGSNNFYLYNHPSRGLVFIPYDLDDSFDDLEYDIDPMLLRPGGTPRQHFDALMAVPRWHDFFLAKLDEARAAYNPEKLRGWTTRWAAQIAQAAEDDPNRPFDNGYHLAKLGVMNTFYGQRETFVKDWLFCQHNNSPDSDGDGFGWCRECNDSAGTTFPGAPELCNGVDDDCNGLVDDDPGDTCPDCVPFEFGGSSFLICTRPRTFAASRARCESHGAEVAVPQNALEDAFLYQSAQGLNRYLKLWLGISDEASEGNWTDLSGQPLGYVNWEPDQPRDGTYGNCAVLHYAHHGQWNDKNCNDENAVVCRVIP